MPRYTRTCDKRGSHQPHGSCGGRRIEDLIEDSSLGTPNAKRLRAQATPPFVSDVAEEQEDWESDDARNTYAWWSDFRDGAT